MARFTGDGKYVSDGAPLLELLWLSLPWKEIKGCDGRYTSKDKDARSLTPAQLLDAVLGRRMSFFSFLPL